MQMTCACMFDYLNKDQEKTVDERKKDLLQKDLDNFVQSTIGRKSDEKSWIKLI